jgi:hypothetical protein
MKRAPHDLRWRRVLAVCAASALLHYGLLDWGATPQRAPGAAPVTVVAELRSAAPAPPGKPVARQAGAAVPLPLVQLPGPKAVKPAPPPYRASLPPSAQLAYAVQRSAGEGAGEGAGSAVIDWRHGHGQYRLALRTVVDDSVLLELVSEGATGAGGMLPRSMSAQRRGKARTATHMNAAEARITFSASEASVPMAPGTQDRASLPMQLAGIGRAGAGQLEAGVALLVAEEKSATLMRFSVVGQEPVETGMGRLATWHLLSEPAPDTYRPRLEVWLAPQQQWYPVQLRSTEAGGLVTTHTVVQIVVHDAGN